jgi:uncharacterized membrane protein YhaH (DUF805 family)
MFSAAANPLANWLWKDLYVWPQGRMARAAYLGSLFRILIVYVIFAQMLGVFSPALLGTFNNADPDKLFKGMMWGQIGALVLIGFPVWSVFQRRVNDMRPDIRSKLSNWSITFPMFLIGLIGFMVANAAGFDLFFDNGDLSNIRFWFTVMLVGAAFVPGGETEAAMTQTSPVRGEPDFLQVAAHEVFTIKVPPKQDIRHMPVPHTDRPRPVLAGDSLPVIERSYKLPEQGRVKPGWFS